MSAPQPGKLAGKVALVTGGGTGVGRGIALAFAREGATVIVTGRREDALGGVVGEIEAGGGNGRAIASNVGDVAAVTDLIRAASEPAGLDIVVNNAGTYIPLSLEETEPDDWDRVLVTNLRGPYLVARAALPALAERRGSLLNISSTIGARPVPGAAAYCVSKAGLDMLTRVIALEWAPRGVRANSILLGIVDTPIHEARGIDDRAAWEEQVNGMHPIGRMGQPADAASAAVFLASDEAAWVTGSLFVVDGGISLA